jgi:hypothetical protein
VRDLGGCRLSAGDLNWGLRRGTQRNVGLLAMALTAQISSSGSSRETPSLTYGHVQRLHSTQPTSLSPKRLISMSSCVQ